MYVVVYIVCKYRLISRRRLQNLEIKIKTDQSNLSIKIPLSPYTYKYVSLHLVLHLLSTFHMYFTRIIAFIISGFFFFCFNSKLRCLAHICTAYTHIQTHIYRWTCR